LGQEGLDLIVRWREWYVASLPVFSSRASDLRNRESGDGEVDCESDLWSRAERWIVRVICSRGQRGGL